MHDQNYWSGQNLLNRRRLGLGVEESAETKDSTCIILTFFRSFLSSLSVIFCSIIIIVYLKTAKVVGAPQIISQPVSSIFSCSSPPPGTWRTPGLSIPWGSRDSLLVRAPDSWWKDCEFKSRQERRKNFLLQSQLCVLTLIRCPFHPRVTAVARKHPGHSAKSAGGRLHLNTHAPLTQRSRSGLTMLLSRHSVGTYQETSSHATRQGTLGHSRLSSLGHRRLILA